MGPLPLDNAIISAPLARNAKFHSPLLLTVRQSKLRKGPRRPLGPPPASCEADPTTDPSETISIHVHSAYSHSNRETFKAIPINGFNWYFNRFLIVHH